MNYLDIVRLALPETVVVITALVVLTAGLTIGRERPHLCSALAVIGLALAIAALFALPANGRLLNGMIVISPVTSLFKLVCLLLAGFTVLLPEGRRSPRHHGEYLGILLLATVGLLLLVGTEELLVVFIGLELTGLCLYLLTAFDKAAASSAEAGLKYFLFGSTASAFTLFGLSLVYGMSGSTSLVVIGQKIAGVPAQPLLAAGIVMTLVGLAFKIAAAPFHLWAPDAYQAAPVPSAAFIASGSKVASFFVLGKIVLIGFGPLAGSAGWHAMIAGWTPLLAVLSALSIVIGNLAALVQSNVRRLLAYSAVAHAGYTLLGLLAGGEQGFRATMFYATVYAFTLVGAFGVVGVVRRQTGGDDLSNFAGLRSNSPLLAGCLAIFMLSLAGLPPLAGFFGKFYLFSAALGSGGQFGLLWLVALALLGSLVSLYYYLLVLKVVFVDATAAAQPAEPHGSNGAGWERLPIALLALIVLFLGLSPATLISRIVASFP